MTAGEFRWVESEADLMGLVAAATGEIPEMVAAMGRSLYTWRTVDQELRELQEGDEGPPPPGSTAIPAAQPKRSGAQGSECGAG